ncbi:SPW repeat domain-containing protein [Natronolimnohabitans innermongolicus]|uniref:SPW repeat-containing integral membrane domain-containing protein n=1 Tax=Natronolimnohabitans innermongolicus JCM 12255 TaxID=1227499 RepID=L9WQ68_9EURY|nr:hypothetical protein [Natronolimnohabitans innermongolicus]ELY51640.1 hypothetical protein C493_16961 [Natronolimnohabitans innermongolicus JCM 12255]
MSDSNRDDRDPETASGTETGPDGEERVNAPSDDVDSGTGVGDRDDPGRDPRDDATKVANEERRRKVSVISGVIAVIGAWVALSVIGLYDVSAAAFWNNVLVGGVVFVAAGYNYYRVTNDIPLSVGVSGLIALLGIWLIVAPAVLEMPAGAGLADSPFWSTLGSGLLIAALAGYNAYDAREAQRVATDTTGA